MAKKSKTKTVKKKTVKKSAAKSKPRKRITAAAKKAGKSKSSAGKKLAKKAGKSKSSAGKKPAKKAGSAKASKRSKTSSSFSKKDMNLFKERLLQERDRLMDEIRHITGENLMKSQRDSTGALSGYAFHMADVASDNYDREFSLSVASDEQRIIYLIDEALKRIEEGDYGICMECNKSIPKNRLKALPYALMCVSCQETLEKNKRNQDR